MSHGADQRVAELERENARLRSELARAPQDRGVGAEGGVRERADDEAAVEHSATALDKDAVQRYGRQLLVRSFGAAAQRRLLGSAALVVGAGGLGCPVALYLAGMGIGRLGIVDMDTVDRSNLHRQVAHREADAGTPKASSLARAVLALNSSIKVEAVHEKFTAENGVRLVARYDVVLDATDNAATRYLINDACVLAGKPLVSGAALGTDGQISVFNHAGGPCYRCIHPVPPSSMVSQSCSEGGVLGAVPGVVGCLQAVEAVKVLTAVGSPLVARLGLYDALAARFRVVTLRPRRPDCPSCGTEGAGVRSLLDTCVACGAAGLRSRAGAAPHTTPTREAFLQQHGCIADENAACALRRTLVQAEAPVTPEQEWSPAQLAEALRGSLPPALLDVRDRHQAAICALPDSLNVPLSELRGSEQAASLCRDAAAQGRPLVVLCRRGIDSQRALQVLGELGLPADSPVVHLRGGLEAWAREADPSFPMY